MPRSKNSQASAATTANRSPKTVWNDDCDGILISVLEQAKREGQMANNGFKQAVWKRAEKALEGTEQQSGGPRKGAAACTNRFSTLKKDYKDVKFLLTGGASGFGWNEETRTVTAPDSVWEDFLVKHSHLAKWRERSFPLYEELGGLIDGRYAVGKNVFHAEAETESEASDTNAREDIDGVNIDDEPDSQVAVSQDETQVTSSSESSRAASAPPTMAEEAQERAVSSGGDPTTSTSAAAMCIASQNEASTGSGRKRSAEEEESEVHRPVKRARGHARSQRTNTASSLEHIAESLQDVARAFILDTTPAAAPSLPPPVLLADSEPPPHLLDVMATPARRRVAICSVERDGGLAPFDFVKAVKLIQGDIAIADVYLAMQQPQNRREFITSLLADM